MRLVLHNGDCVEVLKSYAEGSIGSVISDPPYGLEFMGKDWDRLDWTMQASFTSGGSDRFKSSPPLPSYGSSSENRICRTCGGSERGRDRVGFIKCRCPSPDFPEKKVKAGDVGRKIQGSHAMWLAEVHRVLKPGGVIKAFSGSRTYHRLAAAMADAGFIEIGLEAWTYGSGFPKSKNISLFIDKAAGAVGDRGRAIPTASTYLPGDGKYGVDGEWLTSNPVVPYAPVLPEAKAWDGWGTALKPAWEPILVGRKPL